MKKKKIEVVTFILRKDIYQSNPLIQARKDFDVIGMRVFFLGLRGLNPHFSERDKYYDAEFNRLFIPTSKVTELFGGNTKYLKELKKACTKLFDAIVELNYADGGFKLMHMFDELEYKPKEGLYLQFSRKMRPYILDLFQTRGYTRINVEYLFKLSSPYAVRLLELLLQYQNIKQFKELMEIKRKLTIEELRFALNVPEDTYSDRMDNFKKFVLDDPIKEINTRTPYIVRYETVKTGRKVVAFEFIMDTYNVPKDEEDSYKVKGSNDAIRTLCSMGFAERDAQAIFAKCKDTADCFSRINRAQAVLTRSKKPVENKLGFLREAIEKNWQVGRKPNTEFKRGRKGTSVRDSVRNIDSLDDSMMPIGQILKVAFPKLVSKTETDESQEKPKLIKAGKKNIPYSLAETFIKYIRKEEFLDSIKESLQEYNITIERFMKLCEKHGL